MNKIKLIVLTLISVFFCSCSQKMMDFTLISSKNVDLSKASTFIKDNNKIKGKSSIYIIVIIPTGKLTIDKAVDKAIESVPGCVALADGNVKSNFWMIPCIYYKQSVIIEGTPIIDPSLVFNSKEIPTYSKIELNKEGQIKSLKNISQTEYYALKDDIIKNQKTQDLKI
jgi:hypothetical protein